MVYLETDQSKGKLFWALCTTINDDDDDDDDDNSNDNDNDNNNNNNNNNNMIKIIIIIITKIITINSITSIALFTYKWSGEKSIR